MPRPLVYLLYNLLLPIVLVIGFPSFIVKGIRRGGLRRNFRQRLGFFRPGDLFPEENGAEPVWIHAVSVGEVLLALKAIEAIREARPGQNLVLSVTTTTGFAVAGGHATATLKVIHNPIDLPWITAAVIRRIRPKALVLIEAEIWPNLVGQLHRRGTPVILANARLSPRSAKRYARFRGWIEPIFSQLSAVTVPFSSDVARWTALGIPEERISVLGSVKFDSTSQGGGGKVRELRNWLNSTGMPADTRILLGGSTHEGEEALLARVYLSLREIFPDLALVIVPRHAERAPAIDAQMRELGLSPRFRAELSGTGSNASYEENGTVRVSNTTGELRAWFSLAELVVIGKSFHGEGGQNPVEPILAGKPVIVGPHMENFADVIRDLLSCRGIVQLEDETKLGETLRQFLEDPESGKRLAERGREAMERHEGAAARTAGFLFAQIESAE